MKFFSPQKTGVSVRITFLATLQLQLHSIFLCAQPQIWLYIMYICCAYIDYFSTMNAVSFHYTFCVNACCMKMWLQHYYQRAYASLNTRYFHTHAQTHTHMYYTKYISKNNNVRVGEKIFWPHIRKIMECMSQCHMYILVIYIYIYCWSCV